MRTATRRNLLIAACAFGAVIVIGLVAERHHAARISPAEDRAKLAAEQLRILEGATKGSSAPQSTPAQIAAPASGVDSTAAKPVVIAVVKPWIEIARMPPYVRASAAERMAIRDLYWRICVEEKIPLEQRTMVYSEFLHDWASSESGGPAFPARTSSAQLLREQQARVPSPVDAATMEQWCKR
jgi:hypothetical protein